MKRCIKCKKTKAIKDFETENNQHWTKFCADCWRKNTNDELDRYENTFIYDYFCQKYADALEDNPYYKEASEIDYSGFIDQQEKKLNEKKILKERREKRGVEATNPALQRIIKDIEQLERQLAELRLDQQQVQTQIRQGGIN